MIIAVPDYVLSTFRSNGINDTRLMDSLELIIKNSSGNQSPEQAVLSFFSNKLSAYDVDDIKVLNYLLASSFNLNTPVKELTSDSINKNITSVIENYVDTELRSEDLENVELVDIRPGDGWFLLVIKKGFGNLIRTNLLRTQDYFLNKIVKRLFTLVPEEQVYRSCEFAALNRIIYICSTQNL